MLNNGLFFCFRHRHKCCFLIQGLQTPPVFPTGGECYRPMDMILKEVEDKDYDLIAMGSRGLGAIKGMLMGSVSERVSRAVKCPVLIVKDVVM